MTRLRVPNLFNTAITMFVLLSLLGGGYGCA
jgi:hypothetical protein